MPIRVRWPWKIKIAAHILNEHPAPAAAPQQRDQDMRRPAGDAARR